MDEEQTNNRGEVRATLAALQGRQPATQTVICPDSTYVVDGVLGRAQKWRRRCWQTTSGPARHVDLWTLVLDIVEEIGSEIQGLHVPSQMGIRGNEKADTLADEGRRRSPVLRGYVSAGPLAPKDEEAPPPPCGSAIPTAARDAQRAPPPPSRTCRCTRRNRWTVYHGRWSA